MALDYQNITDYRLGIRENVDISTVTDVTDGDLWAGLASPGFTEVKFVTGVSLTDGGRTKDVTDLGSGQYGKSVREMLGISLNITVEHVLDDDITGTTADELDPGQELLAAASRTTGLASRVIVQWRHPGAVAAEPSLALIPDKGKATFFIATVQDGTHGLGSGGSGGAFVTASYSLVSFGKVHTVTFD